LKSGCDPGVDLGRARRAGRPPAGGAALCGRPTRYSVLRWPRNQPHPQSESRVADVQRIPPRRRAKRGAGRDRENRATLPVCLLPSGLRVGHTLAELGTMPSAD